MKTNKKKTDYINIEVHGIKQVLWDMFEKERVKRNISLPNAIEGALYAWIAIGRASKRIKENVT